MPSLKTSIRDAMREAHDYLVACYEKALPTLQDHLKMAEETDSHVKKSGTN